MEDFLHRHASPDVTYADLRSVRIKTLYIEMKNEEITRCVSGMDSGIGIRVLSNGAIGFAASTDVTRKSAQQCLEKAYKISKNLKGKTVRFEKVNTEKGKAIWKGKKPHETVSIEEKIGYMKELRDLASDYRNVKNLTLTYSESLIETEFYNSNGACILMSVPRTAMRIQAVASTEGKITSVTGSVGGTGGLEIFMKYSPEEELKKTCASAERQLNAQNAPSGVFTVIADPELSGVFAHEALGHACEADGVIAGGSCLAGRLNTRIGNDLVTVVDDPTLPGENGSFPYDDEGTKTCRKVLVEGGILKSYLHSLETATFLGMEKNGSARAESYAAPPLVRMSNTFIEKGDFGFEEMVKEVKFGVYAKGSRGGQVDTTKGTFQFSAQEGFLIENGEITKPLKDLSLASDILSIFHQIDAVGKDLALGHPGNCGKGQWVPVSDGGPHIRIRDVRVGGG
ncbi:MAG: TldD/PmbA family protein [Thermoplasmata archaeon]|nr:TldD/PmbA family protein [Thermoplasmata archaeon]